VSSYATPADYFGKVQPGQPITADAAEIARISSVLEDAEEQVRRVTRGATYTVAASTGLPMEGTLREALRRATVAWAEYLEEVGDTVGAPQQYDAVRYGSVGLTRNGSAASAEKPPAAVQNSPKAMTILRNAGLVSSRVSQSRGA
jgi:hypothetical protein